jgi:hypothetical protein
MDKVGFPYLNFYRLTKEPTFEDMYASFKTNPKNEF